MNRDAVIRHIIRETGCTKSAVANTVALIETGATIPFIARYRKERTGGLDEERIGSIVEKHGYFSELEKRKDAILHAIERLGKLDGKLRDAITSCADKTRLEDLYLPFRPKKKTRALAAREKGLLPLADYIWTQDDSGRSKDEIVEPFVDAGKGVPTAAEALAGARDIIAERIADEGELRGWVRDAVKTRGILVSAVKKEWRGKRSKFEDYYDYFEPLASVPSHRFLAVRRGSCENVLAWKIRVDDDAIVDFIERMTVKVPSFPFADEIRIAARDAYKRLIFPSVENEAFNARLEVHDREAIDVFSRNVRALLLAPPAGERPIMGVDPGYRTGCKLACIGGNGELLAHETIRPFEGRDARERAKETIRSLAEKHAIEIVAVGNGTASKEAAGLVEDALAAVGEKIDLVVVSEAGASVYSASDVARREFPDLDVTVRGAVSIARRLQDPLAELVKIDPKSIGVGQYQHDVDQKALRGSLDRTVESCVNFVGVEVNTASAELLSYVSGVGKSLAANIVDYRKKHGRFRARRDLLDVDKLGEKAFELCAGFLRIRDGDDPLDASGIHPETFPIVERIANDCGCGRGSLLRNPGVLAGVDPKRYVTLEFGLPTIRDILRELGKPGHDPRSKFESVRFSTLVNTLADLGEGMILSGVVTNVTDFGAFVDIGVHQDGLVHISKLSENFVRDPHEILRAGDPVRVRVLSVDETRKRISLERIE
jgi:uncharacterized protein